MAGNIPLPINVQSVLDTLESAGHEAHIVGGCVRDCAMGAAPTDWDICTSALPEQTAALFSRHPLILAGLKHGTVAVVFDHDPIEITTYRIEGEYSDHRRPDTVSFVGSLRDDLSRRDFTVNAMAYHPHRGLSDPFGGLDDLASRTIRCVGDADARFQEDALRILRALRFASVLGFSVEEKTRDAIHRNKGLLQSIAAERIAAELIRLLTGNGVGPVLLEYAPVLGSVIPEILPMIGFEQHNKYHYLDVWEHTAAAVAACRSDDPILRLAVLFHDIGKPPCYTNTDGTGHFYGHPKVSADMAGVILHRLKADNHTIRTVTRLVLYHDAGISGKRIRRWLNRLGVDTFRLLLEVKRADMLAHAPWCHADKLAELDAITARLDEFLAESPCFRIQDLALNGRDLMALGVPEGPEIGKILNRLMELVLDEKLPNDREALLKEAVK